VPQLKRHVAIEIAFERVLTTTFPKEAEVPADARCYICLDGGDTLLRGCACRGASGWAHVDCLAAMAARGPWMKKGGGLGYASRWIVSATCHQEVLTGALKVDMARRCWRHYREDDTVAAPEKRNAADDDTRFASKLAGDALSLNGEGDAGAHLYEKVTRGLPRDDTEVLMSEVKRAYGLRPDAEAVRRLLTELRPRVERCGDFALRADYVNALAIVLFELDLYEDALPFPAEAAAMAAASGGPESDGALARHCIHAVLLVRVGHVEEGLKELLNVSETQIRVLGEDHDVYACKPAH